MQITLYNMVGSDGSWFSPFGWRARVVALAKGLDVKWRDLRVAEMGEALAFADTRSTPLMVCEEGGEVSLYKDTMSVVRACEELSSSPCFFPTSLANEVRLLNELMDDGWQIPGFAAWAPSYFDNGIIAGEDEAIFRIIIERATGRSVEQNAERQLELVDSFQRSLRPFERLLGKADWLLGELSYADVLLFSCLKCFATVNRSIETVVGDDTASLRAWYQRMHIRCRIEDPDGAPTK